MLADKVSLNCKSSQRKTEESPKFGCLYIYMFALQAFKGHENTNENWVLSITSLSGAFNGTTRTYLDGMK